jgi:outer membrane protein TolC
MMPRPLLLGLLLLTLCGCDILPGEYRRHVILPEQRTIDYRDPSQFPPALIPNNVPPRTVSNPQPDTAEWRLSLDEAIRIALENARVIRVLAGTTVSSSGQTIYDAAISNTTIDQEQGRFDPALNQKNLWSRTNTPTGSFGLSNAFITTGAQLNPFVPSQAIITSNPIDTYMNTLGLSKTNLLGGQSTLNWIENPTRFAGLGPFPLNPENPHSVELSYTQPLLQGGGYLVNTAPIAIARLNTEQSFYRYKDSVQEMVRGVIEAYWTLVQTRIDVFARTIQVEQSRAAMDREEARLKVRLGDLATLAQARVSYNQFRANLIAAEASVLTQEGALRNILGLPPSDNRRIIPISAPTGQRLKPEWDALLSLAGERRPNIAELKSIVEADRVRVEQAENQALPKLDALATYRFNGLSGTTPAGNELETRPGQYTDWSVGLNFSLSLGQRQSRAVVRQQSLILARDQANVDQALHAAIHELAGTIRNLDSAYEQYLAFKETRVAAAANVKIQSDIFNAGRTIYLNVLQALNDWGNAVTSEAQQFLTYNIALATLERQTGTILETHGLVFHEEQFLAAGPLGRLGHGRDYPSALVPTGSPNRYPGTANPSENTFDLKNPAPRETKPPEEAPRPRRIPMRVRPVDPMTPPAGIESP